MLHTLDIIGTLVFAISGAFRAVKYELDLLGVLTLATVTGVGGGILRDLAMGTMPPMVFRDEAYLLACIVGGLAVFLAPRRIAARWDWLLAADAVGLSVFAAIGAAKAASAGFGVIGIMMMAAMTACGGGVLRDVLVTEVPIVLRADFYATAALAGGACLIAARRAGLAENAQLLCAAAVTLSLRLLAMKYRISLPKARRLPASPSQLAQMRHTAQETKDGT